MVARKPREVENTGMKEKSGGNPKKKPDKSSIPFAFKPAKKNGKKKPSNKKKS